MSSEPQQSLSAASASDPSGRRVYDAYYTPPALANALVSRLGNIRGLRALEPSGGAGAFVAAMTAAGASVTSIDRDALAPCRPDIVGDFLDHESQYDIVVGNPPYRDAEAHVRHALTLAPRVAMLLRLAFLEGKARRPFWTQHPPSLVSVLVQRPSFTGSGKTDSCAYGWFEWDSTWTLPPVLGWVSWRMGVDK